MTSRPTAWALGLAVLWLNACAVPRVGEPGPRARDEADERAYRKTLERFTAQDQIYGGQANAISPPTDTRLFVAATFQAWAFREARARRTSQFRAEPLPELEHRLAAEKAEENAAHTVFLGVHVNDNQYDDFDRKKSIWRLALVTPAGEVEPVSVKRLGRSNLDLRALYPYLDDFWVAYQVNFPTTFSDGAPVIPAEVGRVTLKLASSLGKAELSMDAR